MKGKIVEFKYVLAASALALAADIAPLSAARADAVVYDSAGLIQGQQSFVQGIDITTPGTLTVTLSNIPWLDTISDLNCFLTTSTNVIGKAMTAGTETLSVGPGMVYAHVFGDANGSFGVGVYGLDIKFQANDGGTPVALPRSVILFVSGIGALWGWRRRRETDGLASEA